MVRMSYFESSDVEGSSLIFSCTTAHASCIFKGEIWLTGGRTAEYVTWNLLNSYKMADVWHSGNGGIEMKQLYS